MNRQRYISLFLALVCFASCLFASARDAEATGSPFIGNNPISLDPNDTVHLAILTLLDSTSAAKLALTYARCSVVNPTVYGLVVGVMYCVKQYISVAVQVYTTGLNNPLSFTVAGFTITPNFLVKLYQATLFLAAFALFGVRIMTMQSENVFQDIMKFVIRMAAVIFLISQAPAIYDTLVLAIGEGIGWITNIISLTATPDTCGPIGDLYVTALNTADASTAGAGYNEYKPWHLVDCMFLRMFGNTPTLSFDFLGIHYDLDIGSGIYASMVPIIAAALFTSSVAATTALLGLGIFVGFLTIIMRAMYIVLISYLTLAFMTILVPFFAPLLVFHSYEENRKSYTQQVFERWYGMILSTVLQPILIVGFLCFAFALMDSFIEGESSNVPGIKTLFQECDGSGGDEYSGVGTVDPARPCCSPGKKPDPASTIPAGFCTFQQLFQTLPPITLLPIPAGNYNYMQEPNPVVGHFQIMGDAQSVSNNCSIVDRANTYIKETAFAQANQVRNKAAGLTVTGPTRLTKSYIYFQQLSLIFMCAGIIAAVLSSLMEKIPDLAQNIVNMVSISLYQNMAVPFENQIKAALNGAKDGVAGAEAGTGLFGGGGLGGLAALPGTALKGIQGAGKGILDSLVTRR